MRSLFAFGILFFALSFCGITDKIKETVEDTTKSSAPTSEPGSKDQPDSGKTDGGETAEKPNPTAKQKEIMESGNRTVWDQQGMGWVLPDGWKKQQVSNKMFNYGTPSTGFLIVSISSLGETFPSEISMKAMYDGQQKRKTDGEVDLVRYLEIDNIKGVEFIEAMPEDKSDSRRHQWIGYRNYNNQVQMINVMLASPGTGFDSRADTFGAILYSMKFDN